MELILDVFLDPRVLPYERQYLMGQETWDSELFAKSGLIDVDSISSAFA